MLSCLERDGGVSSVRFKPRRTHLARHQSQTVQHCPRGTMPWCEVCGGKGVGREEEEATKSTSALLLTTTSPGTGTTRGAHQHTHEILSQPAHSNDRVVRLPLVALPAHLPHPDCRLSPRPPPRGAPRD